MSRKDHRSGEGRVHLPVVWQLYWNFCVKFFTLCEVQICYLDPEPIRSKMMAEMYLTSHMVDLGTRPMPNLKVKQNKLKLKMLIYSRAKNSLKC